MTEFSQRPTVSVIMPVRNEEKFIAGSLEAIYQQTYPHDKIEVILADGMSEDKTLSVIEEFRMRIKTLRIMVIPNHGKIAPIALNLAIRKATGEVIVRMDAHAEYPSDYIELLVGGLYEYEADNVGGIFLSSAYDGSTKSKAIAFAVAHPVGVGNSFHRIGSIVSKEVDTVPYGCFRRSVFEQIGLFDEELIRNQDDEFNGRMKKAGMKIVIIPEVKIKYYVRDSFRKLFKMFFQYGLFKPLVVKKLNLLPSWRQLIPVLFVLFLIFGVVGSFFNFSWFIVFAGVLFLYLILLSITAFSSVLMGEHQMFFPVIWSFNVIHLSYGLGYLKGLWAIVCGNKSAFKIDSPNR
ncbi:glycosyltransferase family 2 protein [Marinilabilia rubra]|uniref:Glycosyltransferase 2-like domain-containing protein n=1 Tax=Marinilabilia rubra TaxID=2162893 RepID=A0A2U2B4P9_9BACT|nr:glycosyltransferase family 2 protein [Marinilabilia rubra]PWD98017.1 hypothetical protein DDZ16_17595 [Marinilabilia rubra]